MTTGLQHIFHTWPPPAFTMQGAIQASILLLSTFFGQIVLLFIFFSASDVFIELNVHISIKNNNKLFNSEETVTGEEVVAP